LPGHFFAGAPTAGGAPGTIAANAICDDLALKRNSTPLPPPEWKH